MVPPTLREDTQLLQKHACRDSPSLTHSLLLSLSLSFSLSRSLTLCLLLSRSFRRYHQSGLGYVLHTGTGRYRSGRSAIPCVGCAVCDKIDLGCKLTGRFGDTMVCGLANDLHVVLVGTARDALRYQAMMCVVVRGQFVPCTRVQVDDARDALRYHAVGVQAARGQVLAELPTVGTHWCYHGLWVGKDLHVGASRYRSGRFAIPCGGVRGRSFVDCIGLCCRRSGRFGEVCTRMLGWAFYAGNVLHLSAGSIRCSVVDVRTIVGLNRLGDVRVQTWMDFGYISRT